MGAIGDMSSVVPDFFIVGMPRSGTKLVRELLNNSVDVFIPDAETLFIPELLSKYGRSVLSDADRKSVEGEIQNSLFSFHYPSSCEEGVESVALEGETVVDCISYFVYQLSLQRGFEGRLIGEKTPGYLSKVDLIASHFPRSKFIHIVRDPRDYCLSMNRTWGKNIYRAAYRWSEGVGLFRKFSQQIDSRVTEIRYEDLVKKPGETISSLCDFLGINYDESMIVLQRAVEAEGDARDKRIAEGNSNKYMSGLSKRTVAKIESITEPLLTAYSYRVTSKTVTPFRVSGARLYYWKFLDGLNMCKYSINKYGFRLGLQNYILAYRHKE